MQPTVQSSQYRIGLGSTRDRGLAVSQSKWNSAAANSPFRQQDYLRLDGYRFRPSDYHYHHLPLRLLHLRTNGGVGTC
jgi:hypothetical protein